MAHMHLLIYVYSDVKSKEREYNNEKAYTVRPSLHAYISATPRIKLPIFFVLLFSPTSRLIRDIYKPAGVRLK